MPPEPELIILVSFECSHCKAVQECPADQPGAWIRCPKCGRANRSPEAVVRRPATRVDLGLDIYRSEPASVPEPSSMTTGTVTPPVREDHEPSPREIEMVYAPTPVWRVVSGAVLFVSVIGLLFSFLEKSEIGIIGSGVGAVVALVVLIRGGSR